MRSRTKKRGVQGMLFGPGRGGKRLGAGRKPKGERAGVSHAARTKLAKRFPVHVTMRIAAGLPSLRDPHTEQSLRAVFCAMKPRRGFRIVHYSIQTNHVHLIVEAESTTALSRGMQSSAIRMARRRSMRLGPAVRSSAIATASISIALRVRNAIPYAQERVAGRCARRPVRVGVVLHGLAREGQGERSR
ncbi:MAG: transposase [Planctomycetes bacterium]|nr:transposase [Planctomycetota bacterium]